MWCANCQADVAAEVLDDNRSVRCANCQSSLGALRGADPTERTRQARELLERWAHSGIVDPSSVRSSEVPLPGEPGATGPAAIDASRDAEPAPPAATQYSPQAVPSATTEDETGSTPPPHDDEPAVPAPKSRRKLRFDAAEHPQESTLPAESDDTRRSASLPRSGQRRVRLDEPHSGETTGHELPASRQAEAEHRHEPSTARQEAPAPQPPRYQRMDNRPGSSAAPRRQAGQPAYRVSAARPRRPHFADVTEQYSEVHPPHPAMPHPHFDPASLAASPEPAPSNWLSVVGPVLAYLGVGLLTVGTVLVLWAWFGGPADYAPTGWLITTAGQMLLFLGIVTLVSGGMEQTTTEVRTRIAHLGERILRIEHVSRDHALHGPSIPSERFDRAARHPDEHHTREQAPQPRHR